MPFAELRLYAQISLVMVGAALSAGCVNYTARLEGDAHAAGRMTELYTGGIYPVQAVLPKTLKGKVLRVYIEGDGHAWATASQPSTDPTPHENLVANLAANDPGGAVYLARPCQYVTNEHCNPKAWTDQRFSPQVIADMSSALDAIKLRYPVTRIELVGYSGGGAVALLLAGQRDDVVSVQTLAGNIAVTAWTHLHGLTPLNGSLDPVNYANKLRAIPQRHMVGDQDTVVPHAVSSAYLSKLSSTQCVEIATVHANHQDGWPAAWAVYSQRPISCVK
ncbi:alpha/beta hydrolase family protein [Pseudomonas veronii]|uniref:alpha/beta hydrolase n=1 Tax=Pseudomonas veronii TaxID=76761 RepID=UPI0021BE4558|nr:alpha/beta hydrolase [Pseudomonas veronii]MCT9826010.1 alpha/beta hydrolase [Pseudomonas veronii]